MILFSDMHSHTHQENWPHFACSWFTGTLLLSQPVLVSRVKLTLMGPHQVTAVPFCLELVLCFVCTQPPSLLYFHFQFWHMPLIHPCSYADIPLSASVGKNFLQRVNDSAVNMRLPVVSISAGALNNGGIGFSAPLSVRVGADVTEELLRLLRCSEADENVLDECCLIGEVCGISHRQATASTSSNINGGNSIIASSECPPSTFHMCAAQGWLCRRHPRVIWDR